jgi:general secretion pathway protein F
MAAFFYDALDGAGSKVQGVLEAENLRLARAHLRESGLLVIKVHAVSRHSLDTEGRFSLGKLHFGSGVSSAQLSLITRQMATLLDAGLTLEEVLSTLIEQSEDGALRTLIAGVRAEILSGKTLAKALGQYETVFPEIYRALVHAGETSGNLGSVMLRLADYTESRQALQQKVGLAFVYPAIVTLVALLVVGGLLIYVVPQVVTVFQNTHQQLPLLTRLMMGLSTLLQATWPYLILASVLAAFGSRALLKREEIRHSIHLRLLQTPLVGRLIRGVNTARMASTLAILVGSGVPLLNALQSASGVVDNLPMKKALEDAAQQVREGVSLSRALTASGYFPPIMIHLISSGESSGKLDAMLERAAIQQEQEVSSFVTVLTSLLEPLLILIMGVVVLLIVLAILMPIIDMNQMVH